MVKHKRRGFARLLPALIALFVHGVAFAVVKTSTGTGNWNTAGTWAPNGVPAATDDVVIANGHTVTLNANLTCRMLTINAGGTLRGDAVGGRTLSVGRNNGAEDVTLTGTLNFTGANAATLRLNLNSQWGGSGTVNLSDLNLNTRTLNFTAATTLTINLSAAAPITNAGTVNSLATITWNFNGTALQTLPTSANVRYGAMRINNTAGVTLGVALSATSILDNLSVQTGTLNNGGFAIVGVAGKTFSVSSGATFNLTGTSTMVTGFSTKTFGATSTVNYGGTNQTVTAETYGHLTLSTSGTKTMPGSATTVAGNFTTSGTISATAAAAFDFNGNFTIGSGTTFNCGSFTHTLAGNFQNDGTFTGSTSTFTFDGTTAQTISGSVAANFNNITIANTSATVTANSNFNVSGTATVNANATLSAAAATVCNNAAAAGTLTGSGTVMVTRTAATADFTSQYKFSTNTLTNLTIDYNGTGQVLSNLTYGKLRVSGSITGANNNATVTSTFTTTGTFTPTSGTITMNNGSSIVNSGTLTFSDLTIAASATVTTSSSFGVAGTMTVNAGGLFTPAAASVINSGSAAGTVTGSGTLQVTRIASVADYLNQYNFSTNTLTNLTVEYIGTATQEVSAIQYGHLKINNANDVVLLGTAVVEGTLTMQAGDIDYTTATDTLALGTSTSQLGTLTRTTGTVYGKFRRWFAASTVSNVVFPVGTASYYRPAQISYTSAPTGGTLTAWFVSADPGNAGFNLNDAGTTLVRTAPDGYWTITALNSLSGGTYNLDLTATGFQGITSYQTMHIVKRANISVDWGLDGSHSAGTGSNLIPIAHRTGCSGFSDFALASGDDNPLPVELRKFELKSEDRRVKVRWETGSEIANAGFEIHRADARGDTLTYRVVASYRERSELVGLGTSAVGRAYEYIDGSESGLAAGQTYWYKLVDVATDGTRRDHTAQMIRVEEGGARFGVDSPRPSPARGDLTLRFTLGNREPVTVSIYGVDGRLAKQPIIDREYPAGSHGETIVVDDLEPGAYLIQLSTPTHRRAHPMIVAP